MRWLFGAVRVSAKDFWRGNGVVSWEEFEFGRRGEERCRFVLLLERELGSIFPLLHTVVDHDAGKAQQCLDF